MKVIFFSSGTFGLPAFEALLTSRHEILMVVTSPEKKTGRGQRMKASPVQVAAESRKTRVLTPPDVHAPGFIEILRDLGADVFVVVSFGTIFKKDILDLPPKGCINLHGSLLPKYRGASPIAHALLNGESEVGVTTIKLKRQLDAGDVLLKQPLYLKGDENAEVVTRELSMIGAAVLVRTLDLLEQDRIRPVPQKNSAATPAPKLKKEDAWIDWSKAARKLHNQVRAFYLWPATKCRIHDQSVTVLKTHVGDGPGGKTEPGTLIEIRDPKGMCVQTGQGTLWIEELKPEGKNRMSYKDYLNGRSLKIGDRLSSL